MSVLSDVVSFVMGGIVVGLLWLGSWPLAVLIALAWLAGFWVKR